MKQYSRQISEKSQEPQVVRAHFHHSDNIYTTWESKDPCRPPSPVKQQQVSLKAQ